MNQIEITGWSNRSVFSLLYPDVKFPQKIELTDRFVNGGAFFSGHYVKDCVIIDGVSFNVKCFKVNNK